MKTFKSDYLLNSQVHKTPERSNHRILKDYLEIEGELLKLQNFFRFRGEPSFQTIIKVAWLF